MLVSSEVRLFASFHEILVRHGKSEAVLCLVGIPSESLPPKCRRAEAPEARVGRCRRVLPC